MQCRFPSLHPDNSLSFTPSLRHRLCALPYPGADSRHVEDILLSSSPRLAHPTTCRETLDRHQYSLLSTKHMPTTWRRFDIHQSCQRSPTSLDMQTITTLLLSPPHNSGRRHNRISHKLLYDFRRFECHQMKRLVRDRASHSPLAVYWPNKINRRGRTLRSYLTDHAHSLEGPPTHLPVATESLLDSQHHSGIQGLDAWA